MLEKKFSGFEPPKQEQIPRPGDKLEGFRKKLWEQARNVLNNFVNLTGQENIKKEEDVVNKINGIEKLEKDDDHVDEYLFIDTEVETAEDGRCKLRMIGQIDDDYDPDKKMDYEKENPGYQKEAEKWLSREIIIGQKMSHYLEGEAVSADTLLEANRAMGSNEMFLLKKTEKAGKSGEEFGEAEGRALAQTLLNLQNKLKATDLVNEIMKEEELKDKYELENNVFEDYFDDKQGYLDNVEGEMEELAKDLRKEAWAEMEKRLGVIDACQLKKGEFSLAHGDCKLENMVYTEDGKMLLSNWRRPGTTPNKELSLIYDLGDTYIDAVERINDPNQVKAFFKGIENNISEHYQNKDIITESGKIFGSEIAEAVLKLAKLRAFAMIDRDDLVKQELK